MKVELNVGIINTKTNKKTYKFVAKEVPEVVDIDSFENWLIKTQKMLFDGSYMSTTICQTIEFATVVGIDINCNTSASKIKNSKETKVDVIWHFGEISNGKLFIIDKEAAKKAWQEDTQRNAHFRKVHPRCGDIVGHCQKCGEPLTKSVLKRFEGLCERCYNNEYYGF